MFFTLRRRDLLEAMGWMEANLEEWPYWSNDFEHDARKGNRIKRIDAKTLSAMSSSRSGALPLLFVNKTDWLMMVLMFAGRKGNQHLNQPPSDEIARCLIRYRKR